MSVAKGALLHLHIISITSHGPCSDTSACQSQ